MALYQASLARQYPDRTRGGLLCSTCRGAGIIGLGHENDPSALSMACPDCTDGFAEVQCSCGRHASVASGVHCLCCKEFRCARCVGVECPCWNDEGCLKTCPRSEPYGLSPGERYRTREVHPVVTVSAYDRDAAFRRLVAGVVQ